MSSLIRFEERHLFRIREMVKYFDEAIAKDELAGQTPHKKYASRSALKGLLDGAEQLPKVLSKAHALLKVLDTKLADRVSAGDGPLTCIGCGAKGLNDCSETCWVARVQTAADELDEVLP